MFRNPLAVHTGGWTPSGGPTPTPAPTPAPAPTPQPQAQPRPSWMPPPNGWGPAPAQPAPTINVATAGTGTGNYTPPPQTYGQQAKNLWTAASQGGSDFKNWDTKWGRTTKGGIALGAQMVGEEVLGWTDDKHWNSVLEQLKQKGIVGPRPDQMPLAEAQEWYRRMNPSDRTAGWKKGLEMATALHPIGRYHAMSTGPAAEELIRHVNDGVFETLEDYIDPETGKKAQRLRHGSGFLGDMELRQRNIADRLNFQQTRGMDPNREFGYRLMPQDEWPMAEDNPNANSWDSFKEWFFGREPAKNPKRRFPQTQQP